MSDENGVQATPNAPGGQPQNPKLTPEVEDSELRRARKEAAAARVAKNELATQLEQALSGIDKLTKMFEESEKRRADAEQAAFTAAKQAKREQLINAAATQFKLPAELAKRLQGETAEELLADAESLASLLGTKQETTAGKQKSVAPTRPVITGNAPEAPPPSNPVLDKLRSGFKPGQAPSIYDHELNASKGGAFGDDTE